MDPPPTANSSHNFYSGMKWVCGMIPEPGPDQVINWIVHWGKLSNHGEFMCGGGNFYLLVFGQEIKLYDYVIRYLLFRI